MNTPQPHVRALLHFLLASVLLLMIRAGREGETPPPSARLCSKHHFHRSRQQSQEIRAFFTVSDAVNTRFALQPSTHSTDNNAATLMQSIRERQHR